MMGTEYTREICEYNPVEPLQQNSRLFDLPTEMVQLIADFLAIKDIHSLSQTCRHFYQILNDDKFWIHRMNSRLPSAIVKLYTLDLFESPNTIETHDEIRQPGFVNARADSNFDRAAINCATHYSDEAIERRHAKMFITKVDFLSNVKFYQYKQCDDYTNVPFMKVVYFYLIDRKRCAAVNMDVVHRNEYYLVERNEPDSLVGRIIHLQSVCWLEITGSLEHKLMPGKYDVTWRMRIDVANIHMSGEMEFIVVPQYGRLLHHTMSEDDFNALALSHQESWFTVNIGQTIIYEPSFVRVAIRNWSTPSWKHGLSWDCIELKVAL